MKIKSVIASLNHFVAPKTASAKQAQSLAREIAAVMKSAARTFDGDSNSTSGGGSLDVHGFPLLIVSVVKDNGPTASIHIDHLPTKDENHVYAYDDDDYNAFSKAMQTLGPAMAANSKVRYTDNGASADFAVYYDTISKFSTLLTVAVNGLFNRPE